MDSSLVLRKATVVPLFLVNTIEDFDRSNESALKTYSMSL